MHVTRRAEFSASHFCRVPSLTDVENRQLFGEEANLNGHGHNFIVEITLEGEPDPVTGMVVDLKRVKTLLEEEVIHPMDHRFLNYEVAPFDRIIPTAPNIAQEIWRRLEARLTGLDYSLSSVRLFETADLYVDVTRVEVTRDQNSDLKTDAASAEERAA
jgi:6-pyruvoyltetrahydropterin/6-carboxytetrahydropterin synthase